MLSESLRKIHLLYLHILTLSQKSSKYDFSFGYYIYFFSRELWIQYGDSYQGMPQPHSKQRVPKILIVSMITFIPIHLLTFCL